MARLAGGGLQKGSSADMSFGAHPSLADLTESLKFSPGDGRIWLNDQRMVLMHASSLGELRRELVESLGVEKTRGMLTRVGYASGARDAHLVRQCWPDSEPAEAFAAGPRLHSVEGVVQVEPVRFEFDAAKGQFYGEFLWRHSVEDDHEIEQHGIGRESACWMQIGYASGYASTFLGRLIVYREVECRSSGADVCRIIGKPIDEWDDPEEEIRYLSAENFSNALREPPVAAQSGSERPLVGVSPSFNAATHMIRRVAPTQATVLFTGESGVGKEMFARQLHQISNRARAAFVGVNCAAIPDALVESELFGVERGAYTGAVSARPGRFERANGGTLFLDEIGSLSLVAQGKLLRALQEREIERVGGTKTIKIDVRVVAATNVDLKKAVGQGQFREDLFYRLHVFPVHLPPLRERREDIPLLTDYFLHRFTGLHSRSIRGVSHTSVNALLAYAFPGNVRELENMVERAVILAPDNGVIEAFHLFSPQQGSDAAPPRSHQVPGSNIRDTTLLVEQFLERCTTGMTLQDFEREAYARAVSSECGNLTKAARVLGLTRAQLAYRIRNLESN